MTNAFSNFKIHIEEGRYCLENFEKTADEFSLRHVWISAVSAFDLYMTELVSEIGLRLIDRNPPIFTANLRSVSVSLGDALSIQNMSPSEKLIFYRDRIYEAVRFKSFYKPEKVSEALSYIWTCPPKEKWARILAPMKASGRYDINTEQDIRAKLELIGERRDLIAHAMDMNPGEKARNLAKKEDAVEVLSFIRDLAYAIDTETETQIK